MHNYAYERRYIRLLTDLYTADFLVTHSKSEHVYYKQDDRNRYKMHKYTLFSTIKLLIKNSPNIVSKSVNNGLVLYVTCIYESFT